MAGSPRCRPARRAPRREADLEIAELSVGFVVVGERVQELDPRGVLIAGNASSSPVPAPAPAPTAAGGTEDDLAGNGQFPARPYEPVRTFTAQMRATTCWGGLAATAPRSESGSQPRSPARCPSCSRAAVSASLLDWRHCGSQGSRQCAAEGSCPAGRDGEVQVPEFVHTLLASRVRTPSVSPPTRRGRSEPGRGSVRARPSFALGFADVGPIPWRVVDRRRACPEHEAAVRAGVATRAAVARGEQRSRLRAAASRSALGLPGWFAIPMSSMRARLRGRRVAVSHLWIDRDAIVVGAARPADRACPA